MADTYQTNCSECNLEMDWISDGETLPICDDCLIITPSKKDEVKGIALDEWINCYGNDFHQEISREQFIDHVVEIFKDYLTE